MKPAMIAGRGGEGKNQKNKAQNIQPYKIETQTLNIFMLLKVERMLGLTIFYFFSSKQGREKNLPAYNGKFRNPSVKARSNPQTESAYRVPELHRVLHSMTRTCC
jgi:hypothetical protein